MATYEELNIKVTVDGSGIDQLGQKIGEIDKKIGKLTARKGEIELELKKSGQKFKLEQELDEIDKQLTDLERKRRLTIELDATKAAEVQSKVTGLIKGFAALTQAAAATGAMIMGSATLAAKSLDKIDKESQKLGMTVKTFQELDYAAKASGTKVEALSMAMSTLVQRASGKAAVFKRIGVNVKDANGQLKKQEVLFEETLTALQKYEAGTERSAVAMELFGRSAKDLEPILNNSADSFAKLREEAHEYGAVMDATTIRQGVEAAEAFDKMGNTIKNVFMAAMSGALPYVTDMYNGMSNLAKEIIPLARNFIPSLVETVKSLVPLFAGAAAGAATYAIAMGAIPAVASAVTASILGMAASFKALTAAMMTNPIGLLVVGITALVAAVVWAIMNWDYFVINFEYGITVIDKSFKIAVLNMQDMWLTGMKVIKVAFYETMQWIVEYLSSKVLPGLDILAKLPLDMGEPFRIAAEQVKEFSNQINDGLQGTIDAIKKETAEKIQKNDIEKKIHNEKLESERLKRKAALEALKASNKAHEAEVEAAEELSVLDKMLLHSAEQAEEGKIAALTKRHKAQREIAQRTIKDEDELKAALLAIDKAYYTELERLTRENYENRLAIGEELTKAHIDQLRAIVAKNKELAADTGPLVELEKNYNTRVQLLRRTVDNEAELEAKLLELRKEYLQARLNLLMLEAQAAAAVSGKVSNDVIEAIKKVQSELQSLEGSGIAAKMSEQIASWGQYFNSIAMNMGTYFSNYYDARIQSLDEAHKRELRMIDNRLQAELAMYEEQLKAYEDLDERRADAQREHEERLAEFNEKIQDHMTEEQWQAVQEQIDAEEERYNEQMLILDDEALQRDEIMIQQEMAEAEALARKELMEKEYAIRRAQMERKQAEANKASSLFSAIINVAQGVSKAWAQGGALLGPAFAALVAAAGAIQVAAISARPLPEIPSFSLGGVVSGENRQHFAYLPQPDNPYDNTLIWARAGERVTCPI